MVPMPDNDHAMDAEIHVGLALLRWGSSYQS
jgi:hypothetical protein